MDCPACHALVYAADLNKLSQEAKALEAKSQFAEARDVWNRALMLLPQESTQAQWVRGHLASLDTGSTRAPVPTAKPGTIAKPAQHPWVRRLGPLAPILLVLAKAKSALLILVKLKSILSFFAFIAIYGAAFGWRFGVGFAVSILIHEMGHYIDIKRRGLPAEMPVFLPGLGAYVKWNALGVTLRQKAQISLAGPLAGWIAAATCFLIYTYTHDPLWAALARSGAWLNVLNLIPIWVLDGGKAIASLGMVERVALLAVIVAAGVYAWQPVFLLVAGGAVYRLFTKDKPEREDWSSWFYYAAVLSALAMMMKVTPVPLIHGAVR